MKKNKKSREIEHKLYNISFVAPSTGVDFHWGYQNFTSYHDHDFYEFIIITDGKMQHIHNSNTTQVSKGMFFLMKPNEYHQFLPIDNTPAKQINFSITPQTLEEITAIIWKDDILKKISEQELPYLHLPKKIQSNIFNLVNRINQCAPNSQSIYILIKTILIELIGFLVDNLDTNKSLAHKKNPPAWLTDFLKKLNEPEVFTMQLKDIYPLAPYSQSMLNIYFNKYVDMTLIAYITKQKIQYACNLLQYTDDSPLDISGKLNYDSLSHFNQIFKKITGKTPIEYRRSQISKL